MDISLKRASAQDAPLLYKMQKEAFLPLLVKYGDVNTNPAAEPESKTLARLREPNSDCYFILTQGQAIGGIRILRDHDTCHLKQVYILPAHQGHGYAQQAILQAEAEYPDAVKWKLDTIKQESKLRHLYEKMGYRATGEKALQEGMDLIFYER